MQLVPNQTMHCQILNCLPHATTLSVLYDSRSIVHAKSQRNKYSGGTIHPQTKQMVQGTIFRMGGGGTILWHQLFFHLFCSHTAAYKIILTTSTLPFEFWFDSQQIKLAFKIKYKFGFRFHLFTFYGIVDTCIALHSVHKSSASECGAYYYSAFLLWIFHSINKLQIIMKYMQLYTYKTDIRSQLIH